MKVRVKEAVSTKSRGGSRRQLGEEARPGAGLGQDSREKGAVVNEVGRMAAGTQAKKGPPDFYSV